MKEMWDQRYSAEEYVYGEDANDFFASVLNGLKAGKILLPGEGEGRNALHAARKGWKVHAFDQSTVGMEKALSLCAGENLKIGYEVCDLVEYPFEKDSFDLVALIFFHADPEARAYLHKKSIEALKPGGRIVLQGFHTGQLKHNTGGPKDPAMLFDRQRLEADFASLQTELMEEGEIILEEGPYHQGPAKVISYTGTKI